MVVGGQRQKEREREGGKGTRRKKENGWKKETGDSENQLATA
jgi:hypothetical protein